MYLERKINSHCLLSTVNIERLLNFSIFNSSWHVRLRCLSHDKIYAHVTLYISAIIGWPEDDHECWKSRHN